MMRKEVYTKFNGRNQRRETNLKDLVADELLYCNGLNEIGSRLN
jgi:hypothetical protein